jgi:hypothetical protein
MSFIPGLSDRNRKSMSSPTLLTILSSSENLPLTNAPQLAGADYHKLKWLEPLGLFFVRCQIELHKFISSAVFVGAF